MMILFQALAAVSFTCPEEGVQSPLAPVVEAVEAGQGPVCVADPVITFDENLANPIASVRIPVGAAPGGAGGARVPMPWGNGPATLVRDGDVWVLTVPVEPGAWRLAPAFVEIGGTALQLEATGVVRDDSAHARAELDGNLRASQAILEVEGKNLAILEAWVAHPETIPFDSAAARDASRSDLAAREAELARLRPVLAAKLASESPLGLALAWHGLAFHAEGFEGGPLTELADRALRSQHDDPAAFAAARAEIERFVAAHGLGDDLLVAEEQRTEGSAFRNALARRAADLSILATLAERETAERVRKTADAKAEAATLRESMAKEKARATDLQRELAEPVVSRDRAATDYSTPCRSGL